MEEAPRVASRSPGIALAIILTCQLMFVLDATVVNVALVPIQRTLHFSNAGLSWVLDGYILVFGGLLMLGGRLGDIYGRRRTLLIGIVVFTLASLLGGLATSPTMLLIARVIQGVGAATAAPSTLSLVSAIYPEGPRRNRALAAFTAISAGGGSVGLVAGGAITAWFSWRLCLFINIPIGVAVVSLSPRYLPEPPRNGGRLDIAGAALVTGGLAGIIFAFIRYAETDNLAVLIASVIGGIALLGAFVVVENQRKQPLMPMRLLADRVRGLAYLTILLVPSVMNSMFFFVAQYMERDLHFDALQTGAGFVALSGTMFLWSRVTPHLIGRTGPRRLLIFGLSVVVCSTLWMSQANVSAGYFHSLFFPLILFGIGGGSCFLPLSGIILAGVPAGDTGVASGMLQSMQQTGTALGVAALTIVAAHHGVRDALLTDTAIAAVALSIAVFGLRSPRTAATRRATSAVPVDLEPVSVPILE